MRCPQCRKTNHKDDIYCIWCGAPLQGNAKPAASSAAPETLPSGVRVYRAPVNSRYRRLVPQGIAMLLFFLAGLVATYYISRAPIFGTEENQSAPMPEVLADEDAQPLDTNIVQWEGFTVNAIGICPDETDGGLKIFYTAENRSDYTVACADPQIVVNGYALSSLMYLELPPGESVTDYLWIQTDVLQAVGITEIRELQISLGLVNAEDFTILAQPEPVTIPLKLELP